MSNKSDNRDYRIKLIKKNLIFFTTKECEYFLRENHHKISSTTISNLRENRDNEEKLRKWYESLGKILISKWKSFEEYWYSYEATRVFYEKHSKLLHDNIEKLLRFIYTKDKKSIKHKRLLILCDELCASIDPSLLFMMSNDLFPRSKKEKRTAKHFFEDAIEKLKDITQNNDVIGYFRTRYGQHRESNDLNVLTLISWIDMALNEVYKGRRSTFESSVVIDKSRLIGLWKASNYKDRTDEFWKITCPNFYCEKDIYVASRYKQDDNGNYLCTIYDIRIRKDAQGKIEIGICSPKKIYESYKKADGRFYDISETRLFHIDISEDNTSLNLRRGMHAIQFVRISGKESNVYNQRIKLRSTSKFTRRAATVAFTRDYLYVVVRKNENRKVVRLKRDNEEIDRVAFLTPNDIITVAEIDGVEYLKYEINGGYVSINLYWLLNEAENEYKKTLKYDSDFWE